MMFKEYLKKGVCISMELYPDCITCVINNLLHVAERVLPDPEAQMILLKKVMERFSPELRTGSSAPILTEIAYSVLREMSGVEDPFHDVKEEFNTLMLDLEECYGDLVRNEDDPLHSALVLAGSANLIDFGAFHHVSRERVLSVLAEHMKNTILPENTYASFLGLVDKYRSLLILCDNCGEIVLDKILVRELKKRFPDISITCAVRGRPILNDATIEDAVYVGLDRLCKVLSSGSGIAGFDPGNCPSDFSRIYHESPVVLCKGVGNFESSPFGDERLFYLFIVKCENLSKRLGLPLNSIVFQQARGSLL